MNAPLYNSAVLRLAAEIPHEARLANAQATAERRSPVCGSRVTVDVRLGVDGRVVELGQLVRACALGQASAAIMGRSAIGRTPAELAVARDQLSAFLSGAGELPEGWPGMEVLAPAQAYPARHASIRLAFEAVAEAAAMAAAGAPA